MTSAVATRYGDAAFAIAREQNALDRWEADLNSAATDLQNSDMRLLLDDPNIEFAQKRQIIKQMFESKMEHITLNTIMLMIERGHADHIAELADYFTSLVDKVKGIVVVEVVTAIPLDEAEQERVSARIKALAQATDIRLTTRVDPAIIGGIIIRFGDRLIDASIATRLQQMSRSLS